MEKYGRYKNRIEIFLASDKGKRVLNFFYSWGASIVILGAMFKILHLPYGDYMLAIGLITEFFVFFVFGFENPNAGYQKEEVSPALKSKRPSDHPNATNIQVPQMAELAEAAKKYLEQMSAMSEKMEQFNHVISSQTDTLEHINSSLNRIKDLYDGSIADSSVFQNETKRMAQQLAQLNKVYARLLQAMTVNEVK